MKKILAFLSVLALLVSFGMAFSVTGEFGTKFAMNNDSFLTLNFDSFTFRFSLDSIAPAPVAYMNSELIGITGTTTNTLIPAWTAQNFGRYELTGFKAGDTVTLGVKFGMNGYGYHKVTSFTNTAVTNALDIGYLGMDIEPQFKFALSDTMSVSEKDLAIQYWSMNAKYNDSVFTNETMADNALPKIGIGAQLTMNLSDTLSLNPGASFTIGEKDGHDTSPGNTNIYKDGDNVLKVIANVTLSGDTYKFKVAPYFQMDMMNHNDITNNALTNVTTGTQMKVRAFIGEGIVYRNDATKAYSFNYGDNDSKFDVGDDKKLRSLVLSDQFTINPYFGFETIVSSAYKGIWFNQAVTNDYAYNELVLAIGANDIKYKIDDTYTIDLQALYVMDNSGVINNVTASAGGYTNNMQTNVTTLSIGGNINITIAPNAVIHAGTTFSSYTTVFDTKGDSSTITAANYNTNVTTINHSGLADPTLELGGEVTVGDFAVKGVIKSTVNISSASDSTNFAPQTANLQGGTIATSSQGFGTSWGDLQITYTKDNGHFKLKFSGSTTDELKEKSPVVCAEVGYKF